MRAVENNLSPPRRQERQAVEHSKAFVRDLGVLAANSRKAEIL
jgi:hypothetical protein